MAKGQKPAKVVKQESNNEEESSEESDDEPKYKLQVAKVNFSWLENKIEIADCFKYVTTCFLTWHYHCPKSSKREEDSDKEMEDMEGQTPAAKKNLATPKYQKDQACD